MDKIINMSKVTYRLISKGNNPSTKNMCQIIELTKAQTRHRSGPKKGKFKTIQRSVTRHVSVDTYKKLAGVKNV